MGSLYTKQGSPKDFKKVWKYDSLLNWTKKFIEVAKAAKEAENAKAEIDGYVQELWLIDAEIAHVN